MYKSSARGEINFNADLARPILDGISMQWETLFGATIIERLKYDCSSLASDALFSGLLHVSMLFIGEVTCRYLIIVSHHSATSAVGVPEMHLVCYLLILLLA